MNPKDTNKYQKELEYSALLDSLQELFQERGEVTATDIAERMEQKLHRHVSTYAAGYLYTTLGFVARAKSGQTRYYIVPNLELLEERRAQFCKFKPSIIG
jgi:hypothetical protein